MKQYFIPSLQAAKAEEFPTQTLIKGLKSLSLPCIYYWILISVGIVPCRACSTFTIYFYYYNNLQNVFYYNKKTTA